jgi:UDP-N-acetylmuramate dehydrogenase
LSIVSNKIKDEILSIEGLNFEDNRDLTKFSTMRAISHGAIIHVKNKDSLVKLVEILKNKYEYRVIGWGANFVLPESPKFVLIKLDFLFNKNLINDEEDNYVLPASVSLHQLTSLATKYCLSGWEYFTGVPGSLGGAVFMNAGTNLGEIGSLIKKVWIIDSSGALREEVINKDSFSYRKNNFTREGDIIVEVEICHFGVDKTIASKIESYLKLRQDTQPLKEKTCGCMFKNNVFPTGHCPAGQFLDIMGLKGLSIDGFRISPKHANFLENNDKGHYDGLISAMGFISKELEDQYGVSFEQEIRT